MLPHTGLFLLGKVALQMRIRQPFKYCIWLYIRHYPNFPPLPRFVCFHCILCVLQHQGCVFMCCHCIFPFIFCLIFPIVRYGFHIPSSILRIPIVRCVQIEKLTNGAVTRKDLRPDDWHEIWPELKED